MDTKILEDIGLTQREIKVYLALLELGPSTAGSVLEKANLQNSVFHFCVNRLIDKGLVSYVKKGKVRVYQAADPDQFLIYVKDKENQVQKLLPELKAKQSFAKDKQEVELFEGIKGIYTLMNTMINNAKRGDEHLFFSADIDEINEDIQKFFRRFDAKRKDKGILAKGIAPKKLKYLFKGRPIKMKYTNTPIPANSAVCGDMLNYIVWGDKPTGVLIKSKHIAKKQKEFFKELWNSIR
ncbi:hypothetical protein KY337_06395 [Candidatus Woesearchaeota archaeon]|nr:hypothetical protein [Candidatus Woesearchaeota archaeon]